MTLRRDPDRSLTLDGTWELLLDPDPRPRLVQVPSPWEAALPGGSGRGRPHGTYRRAVAIPTAWAGDRIFLRVEAAMSIAVVRLDGTEVGRHEGGYTPFDVELVGARPGSEHRLEIEVTNPLAALTAYPATEAELLDTVPSPVPGLPLAEVQHGKQTWYSSTSGLWKHVSLHARPASHLGRVRVLPDRAHERATVRWTVEGRPGTVSIAVEDGSGRRLAGAEGIPAATGEVELALPGAAPWSPESPVLHELVVRHEGDGSAADEVRVRFGLRDVTTAEGRILLNGRPLLLAGALDQYLHPTTLVTFTAAEHRERMERARELGLNLVRCHITVPDQEYLDAADELGMLLWCELPNWTRMSPEAGARGERALAEILDALGNHPSLVVWTVINEDWGTRVREQASDRAWVRTTAAALRAADPTRLVVDNSPCDTADGPNFHLESDLADFHAYRRMPDGLASWERFCAEFADRPDWLWSPHGDARPRGDEPLVVSEFGNWGLPAASALDAHGTDPWWRTTTRETASAAGWEERFAAGPYALVWPSLDALAEETQWLQFEALQAQIGAMRRHPSIAGWVITEFTDAFWEANGLLDVGGSPKAFHHRMAELQGRDALVVRPRRWDAWDDEPLELELLLSSVDGRGGPATLAWRIDCGEAHREGTLPVDLGAGGATVVPLPVPAMTPPPVEAPASAVLSLVLTDGAGRAIAGSAHRLAILPARARRAARALVVGLDASAAGLRETLEALGHRVAAAGEAAVDLVVTGRLAGSADGPADGSETSLRPPRLVVATGAELPADDPVRVLSRREAPAPDAWKGDWISAFAWIDAARFRVPPERILGFPYASLYPDHLIQSDTGAGETLAGFFVGWLDLPAAVVLRDDARGRVVTTLRLAEGGALAHVLLDDLVALTAALPVAPGEVPAPSR